MSNSLSFILHKKPESITLKGRDFSFNIRQY